VNKLDPSSLGEGDLMDCRPVAIGNTLRKAVTRTLFNPFLQDIIAETKPTQFGCGEKAGGSQMIFAISLILEACPDFVCMALYLKNAYNKISREDCLEEVWRLGQSAERAPHFPPLRSGKIAQRGKRGSLN